MALATNQLEIGKKLVATFVDIQGETQQISAGLLTIMPVQDVELVYSTKRLTLFIVPKPVNPWIIISNTGQKLECKAQQDAKTFMTEMKVLAIFAKNLYN